MGRERIVENHRFSKVQVRAGQSESESDRMRRKQKNLIFARAISRLIVVRLRLPYDVGPARAFLGEAEKTRLCVVLGPASRVKTSPTRKPHGYFPIFGSCARA